jgi:O-antigen/teichoic acid export membrane protein
MAKIDVATVEDREDLLLQNLLQRRLAGTSAYVAVGQVALLVFNFALLAILARYLSLRDLGIYTILMEMGRIVSLFCQAGTTQGSQKFLGRLVYSNPSILPVVQRRMFVVLLAASTITVVVCALGWKVVTHAMFHNQGIADLGFFGCVIIIVTALQAYYAAVLLAANHMLQSILSSGLVQKALLLIGVAALYWLDMTSAHLMSVLWAWIVSGLASVAFGATFVEYRMWRLRGSQSSSAASLVPGFRELISTSLPMGVTAGMAMVRNSADVIIVGAVLGSASAGVYGPLRSVANLVLFLDQAIRRSVPAMIAASIGKRDITERLCRSAASYGVLAALLPTVVLVCCGGQVLALVFGPKFSNYGGLAAILTGGAFLSGLFGAASSLLQMSGYERRAMYVNMAVTIVSIAIMPFAGASYGLDGVAYISSGFLVLQGVLLMWLAYCLIRVRTYVDVRYLAEGFSSAVRVVAGMFHVSFVRK